MRDIFYSIFIPALGIGSLSIWLVVILFTGPAPYTDILKVSISMLPLSEGKFQEITRDEVISLIEISEAICDSGTILGTEVDTQCWIADNWPLPKSIRWPFNH